MTQEDLREHGVLLPEEEWGERSLDSTVRRLPAVLDFLVAVAGLVASYLGDGGAVTWIGVAVFLAAFGALTWLADRAVLAQRRRVGRVRGARSSDPGSAGSGAPAG